MSYAISFLRREPGQTWDDACEALESRAPETADYAIWSIVAVAAREALGVVSEDLLELRGHPAVHRPSGGVLPGPVERVGALLAFG